MKNIFLFTLFVSVLFACKKKVDELPEPTQTGANSFGAKVDGKLWVPQGFGIAPTAPVLEASYATQGGVLLINARNFSSSPTETEIEIFLTNVSAPGTFQLNQATQKYPNQTGNYGYYIERRFMPRNEWITTPQATGMVQITRFDTAAKIVSGTFNFSAANIDGSSQRLNVTEGRFDIRYQ